MNVKRILTLVRDRPRGIVRLGSVVGEAMSTKRRLFASSECDNERVGQTSVSRWNGSGPTN